MKFGEFNIQYSIQISVDDENVEFQQIQQQQ